MSEIIRETKQKMEAAIDHLRKELSNVRTGRASPGLVEGVMIEVYGTKMRLQELATITAPEPLMLVITPFDANNSGAIGKSIQKANLGVQPIVDGNMVRINVPQMDDERRNEFAKLCHKLGEDAKISVRNVRRESNDFVKKQKQDGDIAEDELKRQEKEIQEQTDRFCKECDTIVQKKEEEIRTI